MADEAVADPNTAPVENSATNNDSAPLPEAGSEGGEDTMLAGGSDAAGEKVGDPTAGKVEDGSDTAADDAGASETPIDYSTLTVPEGMEVDTAAMEQFSELAASMNGGEGLPVEDAQKLVDMQCAMIKGQMDSWDKTFSEWRGEIFSDKEIGGEAWDKTTRPNVMRAVEKYGGRELAEMMLTNKLYGENPHLIRMLNRIGATLSEDTHQGSGNGPGDSGGEEARLRRMFPSHNN